MSPPRLFRAVLPVDDLERAGAFWSRMLGIEVDTAVPSRHYIRTGGAILTLVDTAAHARGHGHEPPPFQPNPDWFYFRVPDLDTTWAIAQELGCPEPRDDEGPGIAKRAWGDRSFYTYDPSGNPVCFIDDLHSDTPPSRVPYTGSAIANLCNLVLPARNLGRSEGFFEELFGLDADTFVPNRHFFMLGDCQLTLADPVQHAKAHELPPPDFRPNPEILYFAVSDLDSSYERAQKLEMQPVDNDDTVAGIHTYPWGERSFYGLDPSGNPISLVDDQTLYTGSA